MKELESSGVDSKVYTSDMKPELSAACAISSKAFKTPPINDDKYIQFLLGLVVDNEVGILIPTIDTELSKLGKNSGLFKQQGCEVILSEEAFIEDCMDKRKTVVFFKKHGISYPRIFSSLEEVVYPVFLKPYAGSRSIDTHVILQESEIGSRLIANPNYIVQEYLDQQLYYEVTMDAYFDSTGVLKCLIPRKRLEVRDGEVSKGLTIRPHYYDEIFDKISGFEGVKGCINIQFFVDVKSENRVLGIEINPRFGGGFPLSCEVGGNFPQWIIQEYLFGKSVSKKTDWKVNTLMLRFDDEVFHYGYKG